MDARDGPVRFTGVSMGREEASNGPLDPGRDRIGRDRRIHDDEAARLGDGQLQEAVSDAAMEREIVRGLEAGPVGRRLAAKPDLDRDVEEDRHVRTKPAGRHGFETVEIVEREAAAVALVGAGRVGEPGADDRRPGGEGRLDHLDDQLMTGGIEQERVGEGVDAAGSRIEQQVTDSLAQDRATWLAGPDDRHTTLREEGLEAG